VPEGRGVFFTAYRQELQNPSILNLITVESPQSRFFIGSGLETKSRTELTEVLQALLFILYLNIN